MDSPIQSGSFILVTTIFLSSLPIANAIDCFKCVSMNGRFPPCDDPFHNNHSLNMIESPCMGGRKGRDGLFPATSCIKIAGVFENKRDGDTRGVCANNPWIARSVCKRFSWNADPGKRRDEGTMLDDTGETITVRGCGLDSGTVTTDTEIIRMSHCGRFYYNDRYVHGCLQSCNDGDACNSSPGRLQPSVSPLLALYAVILMGTMGR